MQSTFKLNDTEHALQLSRAARGYRLFLGERDVAVDLTDGEDHAARLTVDGRHYDVFIATRGDDVFVQLDGAAYALHHTDPLSHFAAAARGAGADEVRAPMPGSIVSVAVKAGDAVTRGAALLVMESMKMETTLTASRDGVIAEVAFEKGQTFERDALLLRLEPAGDPT